MNFSFDWFYGFKSYFYDLATIRIVIWCKILICVNCLVFWMSDDRELAVMIIQERGKDGKRMLAGRGHKE
jgi:hypothetical protein